MHRCRTISLLVLILSFLIAAPLAFHAHSPADQSLLIINAQLADGTGAPLREGALRIRNNRIASIGKLSLAPGEQVLDAHGLVLAHPRPSPNPLTI
jgi:cytosine/adenosine deaminase-related metal-dependent hydrolase